MALRAQISLMFKDKDLYDNFIVPSKAEKVLNDFIIKCLSAYYYNEEIRNKIEGISMEDVVSDDTIITDSQQICNNIREALAMQSFMATELENAINDGIDDINNIMDKVDDMTEGSGFVKSTQTEYGAGIPLLDLKNPTNQKSSENVSQASQTSGYDANTGYNNFVIEYLMRTVLGTEGIAKMNEEYSALVSGKTKSSENSSSESADSQVVTTEVNESSIFEESKEQAQTGVVSEQIVSEQTVKSEPEPEKTDSDISNDEAEDATDALMDLLGSL